MCSCVFLPAWFSRITESICEVSNLRSLLRNVSGEPISPPRKRARMASGLARFHFSYSSHRLTVPGSGRRAVRLLAVKAQRELEERDAVGAAARLLVGLGAHEIAGDREVRVGHVIGELLLALGEGVVIGVHPGMRRVGRQELEGERAEAAPPGHLDRLERRAGDP